MQNEELVEALKSGDVDSTKKIEAEAEHKFIVFNVGEKKYALPAEIVKEILINQELYFLPFVPAWICGLLNFHGEPSVVVDLQQLLLKKPQEDARKFLVLKEHNGQLAVLVQDVAEILKVKVSQIKEFPADSEESSLFVSLIESPQGEVAVVSVEAVIKMIRADLQHGK